MMVAKAPHSRQRQPRRIQGGYVLLELLLTIGIIAAVLGTVAAIVSTVSTEQAAQREARTIEQVVGDLRLIFMRRNSFEGLTLNHSLAPELGLWPTDQHYGAPPISVFSHWGGSIDFSVAPSFGTANPNTVLEFTVTEVPAEACSVLATYPFSYERLTVDGGAPIYNSDLNGARSDLNVREAASQCADSNNNTIKIWFHKDFL